MAGKVSNKDLFELITQFKVEFTARCDNLVKANEDAIKGLADKVGDYTDRLDRLDRRLDQLDESQLVQTKRFEDMDARIDTVEKGIKDTFNDVLHRLSELEEQSKDFHDVEFPDEIRLLRSENERLKEEHENLKNRTLRRTLVFKNIPETKDHESYQEVKVLLAKTVSSHTQIRYDEVMEGIERAHRESKKTDGTRQGKRNIFCAFLDWDLPQLIISEFKKKCIEDSSFNLYVDQKYGPLTTQRRNLAFELRKKLKAQGQIVSGYVDFPAKLMVNNPGNINIEGKKIYTMHTNFSKTKIEPKFAS